MQAYNISASMLSDRYLSVSPLSVYYICSYCTAAAAAEMPVVLNHLLRIIYILVFDQDKTY